MVFWSQSTTSKTSLFHVRNWEEKKNQDKLLKKMLWFALMLNKWWSQLLVLDQVVSWMSFLKACIFLRLMPWIQLLLLKNKVSYSITLPKGRSLPGSLFVKSTNTWTWTTAVSERWRKLSSGLVVSCSCVKDHLDIWYRQDTLLRIVTTQ